jgi:hypothetical protein
MDKKHVQMLVIRRNFDKLEASKYFKSSMFTFVKEFHEQLQGTTSYNYIKDSLGNT